MKNKLLNFLFPPRCPFCRCILKDALPVCRDCLSLLPYVSGKTCDICGVPIPEYSHHVCADCKIIRKNFTHSFVPLRYADNVQKAIVHLKYYSHPSYSKGFAFLMADKILNDGEKDVNFDYITYVPQNSLTFLRRGYNQSELIAKHLSELLKVECIPTLIRTNAGKRQATLTKKLRLENVKKCYFKTDVKLSGNVLLVDDVYTTGATSNYCAKLLKQMGAKNVYLAISAIRCEDIYEN